VASIVSTALLADSYAPLGGEYPIVGSLPGDQVFPRVAFNGDGGFLVWQDNATDGAGSGISARRLDGSLSGTLSPFRVNLQATGDQQNPRVAMLKNGGAVFVWQGPAGAHSRIQARFMAADGTFVTGDVLVNSYVQNLQIDPAVACLADGNVVITWSSYLQDGSLFGVYGQRFSAAGQKLGTEFPVAQSTLNNQRSSVVAGLPNGNFAVFWVSEKFRSMTNAWDADGSTSSDSGLAQYDVDIYSRFFNPQGVAIGSESKVNSAGRLCANPEVAAASDGSLVVAWSGKNSQIVSGNGLVDMDSWDIYARAFGSTGAPLGNDLRLNAYTYGDQFRPVVSAAAGGYLVAWTTLGEDGSREGVAGQILSLDGQRVGGELHINTTTASQQIYPCVSSDGAGQFLVAWSSFVGGVASFDLFAQRYSASQTLVPPSAPFVSALSQTKLSITWAEMAGYPVAGYEVYVDGSTTPVSVQGNIWNAAGFAPGTIHSFQLAYRLTDGSRSPLSVAATGTTWGEDNNFDGLPDDWQTQYWGANQSAWPGSTVDSDGDGASNLQEFLAGTNPTDAASVLRVSVLASGGGYRLSWNTQPGMIYQVQTCQNPGDWTTVGLGRFAHSTVDSISMGGGNGVQLYRVIRLR